MLLASEQDRAQMRRQCAQTVQKCSPSPAVHGSDRLVVPEGAAVHHHLHHHRSGPRARRGLLLAGLLATSLAAAACGSGSSGTSAASTATTGVTINVVLASDPPPKAAMDEFTKETGITVNWTNVDWDSLQTKISAAAAANTYFADATDVDWSRVGQLGKLGWFYPMEQFLDTKTLAPDMPQIASFTVGGHVIGIPYDASFMVTTVNKNMFAKAGIT